MRNEIPLFIKEKREKSADKFRCPVAVIKRTAETYLRNKKVQI
jgi:hypothetical protein